MKPLIPTLVLAVTLTLALGITLTVTAEEKPTTNLPNTNQELLAGDEDAQLKAFCELAKENFTSQETDLGACDEMYAYQFDQVEESFKFCLSLQEGGEVMLGGQKVLFPELEEMKKVSVDCEGEKKAQLDALKAAYEDCKGAQTQTRVDPLKEACDAVMGEDGEGEK